MPSAYSVRRPVVNAYLVRERDRRRLRDLLLVVAAIAPLGIGLAGYTWLQLETLRVAYRIESLERELRLEAAWLSSPDRLATRARGELGLAEPAVDQVLFAQELER